MMTRFASALLALLLLAPPAQAADAKFMAFLNGTGWAMAKRAGLSQAEFKLAIAGITDPDPRVLEMMKTQPEFTSTTAQYLGKAITQARIDKGRKALAQEAKLLSAIEARYGVNRRALLAIWGMESNFGADIGSMKVIRSLATLAYTGRRQEFGREQLAAAFRILKTGAISPARFNGSWAGAMGHTQFIPTSYLASAVDWDGDGKRDIWGNHADALASTANYLKKAGWNDAQPWGLEVVLPKGFDRGLIGRKTWKTMAQWASLGVAPARGGKLPAPAAKGFVMLPQGLDGPAFIVTTNFVAIMAYNQSHSYAIAVGHLGDRILGGDAFAGEWREPVAELTFAERVELQKRLNAKGFETGGTDGRFGARTYEAIIAFQKARGLKVDGFPGRKLLTALRG
ncbi:MAG: lytic murein transglycosylase [Aestuariivirgaceae bacterium]|nr:lytic murein transglycosylase [Aestuariivirgaceae bacterium]